MALDTRGDPWSRRGIPPGRVAWAVWAACATSAGPADRAKVRGPGHPCTRGKVQAREPVSGAGATWGMDPARRTPVPAARSPRTPPPAGPPTWDSPAVRRRRSAPRGSPPGLRSPGSERAPMRKLHTRIGVGIRVSGAGILFSEDENNQRSARPAPRWPPRRPAATSPPRPATPLGRPPPRRRTPTQNRQGERPPASFGSTSRQGRDQSFHVAEVALPGEVLGTSRMASYLTIFFLSNAYYFIYFKKIYIREPLS